MRIQLLRHATFLLSIGDKQLLVDPMLAKAHSMPPVEHSANQLANPLTELPITIKDWSFLDGLLVTHTHRDHFDAAAAKELPKNIPLFCQPADVQILEGYGFQKVRPVHDSLQWEGILITRTSGRHGTGDIGTKMGTVSGYVLKTPNEPSFYVTGDTIWCQEVSDALAFHQPRITVAFAGAAQFLEGGPITMDAKDLVSLCQAAPYSQLIAIHMEAFNHCLLKRSQLADFLEKHRLLDRVTIPDNGETLVWEA